MGGFRSADVRQLLHNKFIVVLGDSIQRSVYKDLVKFLQKDEFLSESQLKQKGEFTFENDALIEGGQMDQMHNGVTFREVRQYRSGHHIVRFYFLTRAYSTYLESILSDFQSGPQPDVLIANSCVWDVNRYHDTCLEDYKTNLDRLFMRLKEVLSPQCLVVWSMAMPVGYRNSEMPENMPHNLQMDIVGGNFFSATLAHFHKFDVLDMHFHFRCDLRLRCRDAVHWNQVAHRKYTQILLTHISQAWGVEPPNDKMAAGSVLHAAPTHLAKPSKTPKLPPLMKERAPCSQSAMYMPGYTSFDENVLHSVPGVLYPGYYNRGTHSQVVSPFVTDSPLLSTNITPGYFTGPAGPPLLKTPQSHRTPCGPLGPSFLLDGRNVQVSPQAPYMTFDTFRYHVPHSQDWKIRTCKVQRKDYMHPYSRPPVSPHRRIY